VGLLGVGPGQLRLANALTTVLPLVGSGFFVRRLSDSEITEVAQVRENLKLMALRLACGKHSRVQLAGLTTLIEEMAAADPTDFAAHFQLNRRFHRALIEPCGNNLLVGMIDQLWDHPINRRITRFYLLRDPSNVDAMVQQPRHTRRRCGR
jgi:DNA-binding GntR family transcriptional regulator